MFILTTPLSNTPLDGLKSAAKDTLIETSQEQIAAGIEATNIRSDKAVADKYLG